MSVVQYLVESFRGRSRHVFYSVKEGAQERPVFVITPYKKGFAKECELHLVLQANDGFAVDKNGYLRKDGALVEISALSVSRKGDIVIQRSINTDAKEGVCGEVFLPVLTGKKQVREVLDSVMEVGIKSNVPINAQLVYYCW